MLTCNGVLLSELRAEMWGVDVSELKKINQDIEQLREQLHKLVLEKKCHFVDEEVTRLSQELDTLIVKHEKIKLTK